MNIKPSVLVCDDDPRIRLLIKVNLVKHNYRVAEFENGQQLIDYLRCNSADLIILDIGMPTMDGFQTCEWIQQHGIRTPIIVLTAYEDIDYQSRAADMGVHEFMIKPIHLQEFISHVEQALQD